MYMTQRKKTDAKKISPYLMMSIIGGVALMIGVVLGNSGATGPAPSQAASFQQSQPDINGTPGSEAEEKAHENTDSLVVSDNSGTVNVGGTHHHYSDRTPGSEVQERLTTVIREVPVRIVERVVEKPVYIEARIERTVEPEHKIWTRPSVPAESRLGRTMATLKKFDTAGVRLYAEN
jgi:hypothetical protein